jgi:hypothetical protein
MQEIEFLSLRKSNIFWGSIPRRLDTINLNELAYAYTITLNELINTVIGVYQKFFLKYEIEWKNNTFTVLEFTNFHPRKNNLKMKIKAQQTAFRQDITKI